MRLLALPELKIHTLFPCLCFPQQVPDVPRHYHGPQATLPVYTPRPVHLASHLVDLVGYFI